MLNQNFNTPANNPNKSKASTQISSSINNSKIQGGLPKINQSDPILPWNNPHILNPCMPINSVPHPLYFRAVSSIFPETPECQQQCQIPLAIIMKPDSVSQIPVVNYYSTLDTIPHCTFCSSYLCPQCKKIILNGTHSWCCAICGKANAFPSITDPNYSIPFDNLIELSNPVYDIIAPSRYYNMDSQSAFAFIIDMSYSSFSTGFTSQFLLSISKLIEKIPENSRVCILTMSDNLSIFDLKKFREVVIPDLSGMSLTADQNSIFPPLSECKQLFQKAIKILLSRVPPNKPSGNCLLSAIAIAEIIMRGIGGVIISNCVNLPTEGPFGLKNRTGNNEVELLRLPNNELGYAYQEEAIRLNKSGISVHLFCTYETDSNKLPYCDISTISILCRLTNGKCHSYEHFNENQKKNLNNDLFETLFGHFLWNSTLHIRNSYGIEMSRIYSNCILKGNNTLSFPVISKDNSIVIEFNIVKNIIQPKILFQFALFFTTNEGQRIIRVFTFEIPKSNDPGIIYSSIDEAALITVLTRQAISVTLTEGPQAAHYFIKNEIRRIFSIKTKFSSFIYLSNALLCSQILANIHPLGADGRMTMLITLNSLPIIDILLYLYPRLFNVNESEFSILPLQKSSFINGFCFVFHTFNRIYVLIQKNVNSMYVKNVFGIDSIEQITNEIPKLETTENKILQELINDCWSLSGKFLPTEIICQGNPNESKIYESLIDDNESFKELMENMNM